MYGQKDRALSVHELDPTFPAWAPTSWQGMTAIVSSVTWHLALRAFAALQSLLPFHGAQPESTFLSVQAQLTAHLTDEDTKVHREKSPALAREGQCQTL